MKKGEKRRQELLKIAYELFQGRIQGVGPRYCPSIEDKIVRFAERNRHQLFLEPEGRNTNEYYLNGFSSSLPEDIQVEALRLIPGLELAEIYRPGYAIEYDYFNPMQMHYSLESKVVKNLYLAGQVNGTTGYEEAACQGLMAGINAHLSLISEEPLVLSRSQAYIGVLIDDLVTKGVQDPYRMFTSRAEYRILLRQDNADMRLTPIGHKLGIISEERYKSLVSKYERQDRIVDFVKNHTVDHTVVNELLLELSTSPLTQNVKLQNVLLRPQVSVQDIMKYDAEFSSFIKDIGASDEEVVNAETYIKYESYILKEEEMARHLSNLDNVKIPHSFDYKNMQSLSNEAREKLSALKPENLGQASRVSGVNPSDIAALMIYLKQNNL